jgi:hypothetical protein
MPILTRKELYDLVWSMPVTKLAQTFGISDVGLAKVCNRHRIPDTVRLLHWAKEQLNTLETIIDPLRVAEDLRSSKLFPSVDDLHDPFGDPPPPKYPWG